MNVPQVSVNVVVLVFLIWLLMYMYNQRRQINALQKLIAIDPLTNLLNRRAFTQTFGELLKLLPKGDDKRQHRLESLAVFFFDLDHFKRINDSYGHGAGDEVLSAVAGIIKCTLREGDLVCRWGGEEMVAVLPGVDQKLAMKKANEIRQKVSKLTSSRVGLQVTISIGVTLATRQEVLETLITRADMAMYEAKEAGRNRVRIR